jgi:hypothetical protein
MRLKSFQALYGAGEIFVAYARGELLVIPKEDEFGRDAAHG